MLDTISHTGYNSSTKCTIPGKYVLNRVTFPNVGYELRTNESFRDKSDEKYHNKLEKRIIYIDSKSFILIGSQLPDEFSRSPRSLTYLKRYKATEFRQLILYTMPILLKGRIPTKYYNHMLKLHCALRILSSPEDCIRNNKLAAKLIDDLVLQFNDLFGAHCISYNLHSLTHLAQDVLNMGKLLDDFGAFKFENYMQYLKKLPKTGYRALEQIHNRVSEKMNLSYAAFVFKRKPKRNKINKNGLIKKIYFKETRLEIDEPNNLIFLIKMLLKLKIL